MKRILLRAGASCMTALAYAPLVFADDVRIQNPLKSNISTIPQLVSTFLKICVEVALPIISLFIVYSGFMFVFARGNETKLKTARDNFFYVIVGSILILGAWVIATLIGGTVSQLTNGT